MKVWLHYTHSSRLKTSTTKVLGIKALCTMRIFWYQTLSAGIQGSMLRTILRDKDYWWAKLPQKYEYIAVHWEGLAAFISLYEISEEWLHNYSQLYWWHQWDITFLKLSLFYLFYFIFCFYLFIFIYTFCLNFFSIMLRYTRVYF